MILDLSKDDIIRIVDALNEQAQQYEKFDANGLAEKNYAIIRNIENEIKDTCDLKIF